MTSELKAAASRANGAKSRGPKTAETRERSSRNSLRHGIVARKTILLECEDPDEFQAMLDEYGVTYQPGNAIEQDLVDEMVASRWRSGRLSMIVTSLLDMQMDQQNQTPVSADPARPVAIAFRSMADESEALALALRYESRLRRIHERAFATLRELQRERKMADVGAGHARPSAPDEGLPGTEAQSETKPAEAEQAPPPTNIQNPTSNIRSCVRKKISQNEPRLRYALKTFHQPRRGNAPSGASEATK